MISSASPNPTVNQQAEPFLTDITERLMAEFGTQVDLSVITLVVRDCRQDLQGVPPGALPELTERHARQRLLAYTSSLDQEDAVPSPRPHRDSR